MNNIYFIYHPFDKLHKDILNLLFILLTKNNIEFYHSNYEFFDINDDFWNNIQLKLNKNNIIFIYFLHPNYLLTNTQINSNFYNHIYNIKKYLFNLASSLKFKFKKILYITEPLTILQDRKTYLNIIKNYKINDLWTYSKGNLQLLNSFIIPFNRFTLFFDDSLKIINLDLDFNSLIEKRIKNRNKIVFIGNKTKQREDILNSFNEDIIILNNIWTKEDWKEIYENYTYFINIHRIPKCTCLETLRIVPLIINFTYILSEKVNIEEEEEYKNYNIEFIEREKIKERWINIKKENEDINNFIKNTQNIIKNSLNFQNNLEFENDCKKILFKA